MNQTLLILLFVFYGLTGKAQNYRCVQPNVPHYFINNCGYLKGVRVDSVKVLGNDSIYYLFHVARGMDIAGPTDTNGAHWLGKNVQMQPDGTHLFFNHWNDTVIINTQAQLNDSWLIYTDTTKIYYTATVTAIDTMTVLGVLDSVKIISIKAFGPSGIIASDLLNGRQIILSKNNGIVKTVELYLFPLRDVTQSKYGFDYYFSEYTSQCGGVDTNVIQFSLFDFLPPRETEIYDFAKGDIFLSSDSWFSLPPTWYLKKIVDKIVTASEVKYVVNGWHQENTTGAPNGHTTNWFIDTIRARNIFIFPTVAKMPEEWFLQGLYFYDKSDTSFCVNGKYTIRAGHLLKSGELNFFEACPGEGQFKLGLGEIFDRSCLGPPNFRIQELGSYYKNGYSCHGYPSLSAENIIMNEKLLVYPNPADEYISIAASEGCVISIFNSTGQSITSLALGSSMQKINVSGYPAGIYFITVRNNKAGDCYTTKISVQH